MEITEYLHKINTPITLLKVYFSILEEEEKTSSRSDFTEKHLRSCIAAVNEIELIIEQLEKELEEQNQEKRTGS